MRHCEKQFSLNRAAYKKQFPISSVNAKAERSKRGQAWKSFKTATAILVSICFLYLLSFAVVFFMIAHEIWKPTRSTKEMVEAFYAPILGAIERSPKLTDTFQAVEDKMGPRRKPK